MILAAAKNTITLTSRPTNFICLFPLHSYFPGISKSKCTSLCLQTKGCSSVNFRLTSVNNGDCVIVAPQTGADPVVPDEADPGWWYYANTL